MIASRTLDDCKRLHVVGDGQPIGVRLAGPPVPVAPPLCRPGACVEELKVKRVSGISPWSLANEGPSAARPVPELRERHLAVLLGVPQRFLGPVDRQPSHVSEVTLQENFMNTAPSSKGSPREQRPRARRLVPRTIPLGARSVARRSRRPPPASDCQGRRETRPKGGAKHCHRDRGGEVVRGGRDSA